MKVETGGEHISAVGARRRPARPRRWDGTGLAGIAGQVKGRKLV